MAGHPHPNGVPQKGLMGWIEERLPIFSFMKSHTSEYYAPKNFNVWYYFGSLALLVLAGTAVAAPLPARGYCTRARAGAGTMGAPVTVTGRRWRRGSRP